MEQVFQLEQRITDFIVQEMNIPAEDIDTDLNFGAYGLSSVSGTKLIGLLEEELAISISPTLVFEFPTIAELATEICALKQPTAKA